MFDEATALAKLKQFGRPPLLSTESEEAYYTILAQFVECLMPRDTLELSLINNVADFTWEASRYTRYKTLAIESKFRQRLEFEVKRRKELARRKEALANSVAERSKEPANELERMEGLEDVVERSIVDVDEILKRTPEELDHVRALEASIEYHERIDKCLNASIARRDDALDQLERYREGLGGRLRKLSDQIIDGEFDAPEGRKQVAAPPLVPSEGATQ